MIEILKMINWQLDSIIQNNKQIVFFHKQKNIILQFRMPTKSQSVPRLGNQHHRVTLSPIKKSKKKRVLQEKQKKFVLDCTNQQKAKLEEYNYLKDKYLNYCVVKIPRKKRILMNVNSSSQNDIRNENSIKSPQGFKRFLQSKRQQILTQTHLLKAKKQNNFFKTENLDGLSLNLQENNFKNQNKQNQRSFGDENQ